MFKFDLEFIKSNALVIGLVIILAIVIFRCWSKSKKSKKPEKFGTDRTLNFTWNGQTGSNTMASCSNDSQYTMKSVRSDMCSCPKGQRCFGLFKNDQALGANYVYCYSTNPSGDFSLTVNV